MLLFQVPHGTTINVLCLLDYDGQSNTTATCENGKWSDDFPECEQGGEISTTGLHYQLNLYAKGKCLQWPIIQI